jgi:hypothetical protein
MNPLHEPSGAGPGNAFLSNRLGPSGHRISVRRTALLLLFLATAAARAASYHVDAGHAASSDSGVGSENSPWKTVQHAADSARAGDVIIVHPGHYGEVITVKSSGTPELPVTLLAVPSRKARVQGFVLMGDHIRIEGFEITHDAPGAKGIDAGETRTKTARTGCQMTDNFVHDIGGTAITSGEKAFVKGNLMKNVHRGFFVNSGTLVEGNEVDTLTSPMVEKNGVKRLKKTQYAFFAGDDITFRDNYFHGCPMEPMQTWGVDFFVTWDVGGIGPSHRILIERNRCFNATHASECEAMEFKQSSHLTYRNNLFVNTVYVGILSKEWTDITIENNTLINCGAYPIWFQTARQTEGAVVRNNLISYWKHDQRVHAGPPSESGIANKEHPDSKIHCDYNLFWACKNRRYGEHDITAEPQFVDPDNGDFRLKAGSPGIDTGTDTGLATDLAGTPRPQGKGFDIGAYEYREPALTNDLQKP